jgi:opacity protein-like surface antigen
MRKLILTLLLVAACAPFVAAQSENSRFEFFGGYSLLRQDVEGDEDFNDFVNSDDLRNLNGFNIAATGYFTERFGITGDFSAHFNSASVPASATGLTNSVEIRQRSFNYLAGPQIRFTNNSRVTPFVRAMAGVQTNRLSFDNAELQQIIGENSMRSTDFALAIGGGLDIRVSRRVAIRAFQIDYNPVFVNDDQLTGGRERVDNVRFSAGIVFK